MLVGVLGFGMVQAREIRWIRQFGTSGADAVRGIAVDDSGIVVVGIVGGALPGQSFAGGPRDAFLQKYNFGGHLMWTRQFGTPGNDVLSGVAIDPVGGLVVVGSTNGALPGQTNAGGSDAFVRTYDGEGNEGWTRQFGTSGTTGFGDAALGVALDAGGFIYVVGQTDGALPGQVYAGGLDLFVRKYDPVGSEVWTRQFGTPGIDFVAFGGGGIAIEVADEDGDRIYVAGAVEGALRDQTYAGGEADAFVRRYDTAGNEVWTRQFGTETFDDIHHVAVFDGNVYVAGSTGGAFPGFTFAGGVEDTLIRAYDADGDELWTVQMGTPDDDHLNTLAVGATGVFVAGQTRGAFLGLTNAGGADALIQRFTFAGEHSWTLLFGVQEDDFPLAIGLHDDAGLFVGGFTFGTLPGQTNQGSRDAFLVKFLPLVKEED
jgi:hypothetical protein